MSATAKKQDIPKIAGSLADLSGSRLAELDVQAFGTTIRLRELTATDAVVFQDMEADGKFTPELIVEFLQVSIVDEEGRQYLEGVKGKAWLHRQSWTELQALFMKALSLRKITDDEVEAQKKS